MALNSTYICYLNDLHSSFDKFLFMHSFIDNICVIQFYFLVITVKTRRIECEKSFSNQHLHANFTKNKISMQIFEKNNISNKFDNYYPI